MSRSQIADTLQGFLPTGTHFPAKAVGAGLVVVLGALWESLTSVLAILLAALFLADLVLGVLRAIHKRDEFDWGRFARAWIKMGAAIVGIALFTLGDLLLHETGVPDDWKPLTLVALVGMCWGFFWSALGSFGHFFPAVKQTVEAALERVQVVGAQDHDRRRGDADLDR